MSFNGVQLSDVLAFVTCEQKDTFRTTISDWCKSENLLDYPWRQRRSKYDLLIAEILLRRTNARAVERKYGEFLARYPNLISLRTAQSEEIQTIIGSLGLHWRLQNLAELANYVSEQPESYELPTSLSELMRLPGVGPYVARAVLINTTGMRVVAIDANVVRVVCRYFGISASDNLRRNKAFQKFCDQLIDSGLVASARSFNYALLDIGALYCRAQNPKCSICPLSVGGCKRAF